MRDLINIVENAQKTKLRPDKADLAWIMKTREEIRAAEGGGGMCHWVSEAIENRFHWPRASGTYLCKDGDVICGGGHLWNILPDGAILDATADQFGEGHDVRIVAPSDPDYHRYDIEWFEDWHPGHEDYDPSWDRARRTPDKWTGEYDADAQDRLQQERGNYWWLNDLGSMNRYLDAQDAHAGSRNKYRDETERDWRTRRKVTESQIPAVGPEGTDFAGVPLQTVVLKAGTSLFHGSLGEWAQQGETINCPAWFCLTPDGVHEWAPTLDFEYMLEFRLTREVHLLSCKGKAGKIILNDYDNEVPPTDIAWGVIQMGFDGWFAEGEIMIGREDVLKFAGERHHYGRAKFR